MNGKGSLVLYELPETRQPIGRGLLLNLVRTAPDFAIILAKDWRTYNVLATMIQERRKSKLAVIMTRSRNWAQSLHYYRVQKIESL